MVYKMSSDQTGVAKIHSIIIPFARNPDGTVNRSYKDPDNHKMRFWNFTSLKSDKAAATSNSSAVCPRWEEGGSISLLCHSASLS